ncbi:hypothetical protein F4680DRAFT_107656 [Xylaria scruposa]|nr:hypothetical protein F4680DRAFT_107656 [Xylaria scruposa]
MANPLGEFTYQIIASAYKQYQKVVFKMGSGSETCPPDAPERSAEWFEDIMANMTMDNDDESNEELIKEGENHRGRKFPATVDGCAEDNGDWLLVGRKRASNEKTHTMDPAEETHNLDLAAPDGTQTPSTSHRNCPQDLEEVGPNDCNNKCTRHPVSGIDLLLSMTDEQRQADMDMLIAGLQKLTVHETTTVDEEESQTTVDEEKQSEPESSLFGPGETTATDDPELITWDQVPHPVGEVSNPTSSLPSTKRLVFDFLGKNLKAKVQGWRNFFKQPVREPDEQQAKTTPPKYLDPYRYYTLTGYE